MRRDRLLLNDILISIVFNWSRVYETARDHVPVLKPQIEAMLASLPSENP